MLVYPPHITLQKTIVHYKHKNTEPGAGSYGMGDANVPVPTQKILSSRALNWSLCPAITLRHLLVLVLDLHARLHGGFERALLEVIVVPPQRAQRTCRQTTPEQGLEPTSALPTTPRTRSKSVPSRVPPPICGEMTRPFN